MSKLIAPKEDRRGLGIGLLLFAQLFFTVLDTSAKYLSVAGLPTTEIVFVRYGVHVVLAIGLFLPINGLNLFKSNAWRLELLRGLSLLGVTLANFFAMRFLPLTVTGALMFTMPLWVTLLSVPMLGEKVGWRRLVAVLVGFAGVLIIIRPGTEAFHPAALIALAGAVFGALYSIFTRKLAGVDAPATQQVFSGIIALVCVAPFAFEGWVWPSDGPTWFAFCAAGVAGMFAHQVNTIALRYAPPSLLAPFSYTELILLAMASWLVFQQPPDIWFYIGAPVIIGSGIFIWLRETQQRRAAASAKLVEA